MKLVLSLFPGIGLLDMAFEEEGFCVVRGPDLTCGSCGQEYFLSRCVAVSYRSEKVKP